ncbi:MAG TPA: sugar transferase [Terracidiphilus sp.]|nr:sugar transferase [Terracidiphilus sp.]
MATSHFRHKITENAASWGLPAESRNHGCDAAAQKQKRVFDAAVSGLALAAATPLMAAIAALIKLESRGPVFYKSRRWGKGGRVFECIKFRTLGSDGETTRVGRLLRRAALDELPQLVNVLRGEMSLVGPRPVLAAEQADLSPGHLRRFDALPGMTGLWQLEGLEREAGGYFSPDETYARNWSVGLDVEILLRTVPVVVSGGFC